MSSGVSVPRPRTSRMMLPRFTVSGHTTARSTVGAAGFSRESPTLTPPRQGDRPRCKSHCECASSWRWTGEQYPWLFSCELRRNNGQKRSDSCRANRTPDDSATASHYTVSSYRIAKVYNEGRKSVRLWDGSVPRSRGRKAGTADGKTRTSAAESFPAFPAPPALPALSPPRVHFEVRIALAAHPGPDKRALRAQREPVFRAAIVACLPARGDQRPQLIG